MRTHQAKLCLLTVKKNYASILYQTFYQMTFRIVIDIHIVGSSLHVALKMCMKYGFVKCEWLAWKCAVHCDRTLNWKCLMVCWSIHILHKTVRKYCILQMTLKTDLLNVVRVLWLFKRTEEMVRLHTWSYISHINERWMEMCDCSRFRMEITQSYCKSVVNNEQNPREGTWYMVSVKYNQSNCMTTSPKLLSHSGTWDRRYVDLGCQDFGSQLRTYQYI